MIALAMCQTHQIQGRIQSKVLQEIRFALGVFQAQLDSKYLKTKDS